MRKVIYTIKVSSFESRVAVANSFFPTSSTCLIVGNVSIVVYDFQLSFHSKKLISALLMMRKSMLNTIYILISAIKKVFSKIQGLLALLSIKKDAITIRKVLRLEPLIFWVPISVFQT